MQLRLIYITPAEFRRRRTCVRTYVGIRSFDQFHRNFVGTRGNLENDKREACGECFSFSYSFDRKKDSG